MSEVRDNPVDAVAEGRAALARHDWATVYRCFREVDPSELEAADLEGLAEAAGAFMDVETTTVSTGHAHRKYLEAGDIPGAAWTAMRAGIMAGIVADYATMGGWLGTAQRLLEDQPECAAHALVPFFDYHILLNAGDLDGALAKAELITDTARRVGNRDLELMGRQFAGQARARRGEAAEGMAMIDEAMAAAISGQVSPFAFAQMSCQTLTACQRLGDFRRAFEWSDSIERAFLVGGLGNFSPDCKIHRAGILKLQGSWARAEAEARTGCAGHPNPRHIGWGWCEIGEIHLRMGDLEGADEAFAVAYENGYVPHPGLALLRLAQDDVALAWESIEQAYEAVGDDVSMLTPLLDARTDIAIAAGDNAAARASADEMDRAARVCGSAAYLAEASCADGRVKLAEGDPHGAAEALERAVGQLLDVGLPYELATARVALAAARLEIGDRGRAVMDLRAAQAGFTRLGAALDERRVDELLRSLQQAPSDSAAPIVAEKTFMFTDIERSTLLLEALGDRAWDDLLQWHDRTLRGAISDSGGVEVKHEGDGFFVAFDDNAAAVECATAIQDRLAVHRREHGFSPRVRIGVHSGSATERDGDYFGMAVNTTARVMSLAAGDEIMATTQTVPSGTSAGPPQEVRLKGVSEPVTVVTVHWQ